MMKHSKQRDCIYQFLAGRKDHPTAETVYMGIRDQIPKVSLATVYRNLSLLAELGEIQKISNNDGPDRFDADTSPHWHFSCNNCNSVLDLEVNSFPNVEDIAGQRFTGRIQGYSLLFHGLCPNCLNQQAE